MDSIKCPVCGEVNPANAEFCQNCMSRLTPLTGPLKGEDAPLQPGQIPTKKVTAELEPILPQWLREAREKARQSAKEDEADSSLSAQNTTPAAPPAPDLLAGLASQGSDEEAEVPDWLVSLTGSAPAKKKKGESEDAQQVKWVELGGHEDLEDASDSIGATQTPSDVPMENKPPSWMAPQEPAPEKDELADWLSRAGPLPASDHPVESAPAPFSGSMPEDADWLKNLESLSFPSASETQSSDRNAQPTPAPSGEVPDWLRSLQTQPPASDSPAHPSHEEQPAPPQSGAMQAGVPPQGEGAAPAEVPDWLKAFGQAPIQPQPSGSLDASLPQVPDWLKAAAPQVSGDANIPPVAPEVAQGVEDETALAASETPDWLSSLKPTEQQPSAPAADSKALAFTSQESSEPPDSVPAFTDVHAAPGDNVDTLFASLQVPDWLSDSKSNAQPSQELNAPPASDAGETIAPAELPSWVQAMRPVESALPSSPAQSGDSSMEAGGPLAGLQNVLPAGPGFLPTSKPKAYSIKLNATDEHQTQAKLLEQILAAETAPIPMRAAPIVMSQRFLRWIVTVLMILLVGGVLLLGSGVFALPNPTSAAANQVQAAITATDAIPKGAPVLVVFDYEPSLSGEMQAVAMPYLIRLILFNQKLPRLTLLSSSPTGPALAEDLMSKLISGLQPNLQSGAAPIQWYQFGKQYTDLGYLPGGLTGVYDFAQNPTSTMPSGADGSQAWQTPPLQGVTHFSDFRAIIVITDSAEAGRIWIEQAGPFRGNAPLILISSSQAGPMLMPYAASGQINGLINGLNDASIMEQANRQKGLATRYWDAYSVGLLLAASMILLGGFVNLVIGVQARRSAREES